MTKPVTDKQIAYIADLTADTIAHWRKYTGATQRGQAAVMVALTLAIPTPVTSDEASAQIDALKSHNPVIYWRNTGDQERVNALHAAVLAALGTDQATYPDPKADDYLDTINAIINPQPEEEVVDYPAIITTPTTHEAEHAITAAYAAEFDQLDAEYDAARKPEGIIDRFRDDLTADEQAAIDHNDRLLADHLRAIADVHTRRIAALAELHGTTTDHVIARRYGNPVMAS